jgi:hypothetical protein
MASLRALRYSIRRWTAAVTEAIPPGDVVAGP